MISTDSKVRVRYRMVQWDGIDICRGAKGTVTSVQGATVWVRFPAGAEYPFSESDLKEETE